MPSDCCPEVQTLPDVTYISLSDIEAKAQLNSADRRERGEEAARLIREGAAAWAARRQKTHHE